MALLDEAFNAATVPQLMCRNTLSVGWDGRIYDCDFNQMLELDIGEGEVSIFDAEFSLEQLAEIPSPYVSEVRGKGLLIGVQMKPEAGGARRFCVALKDRGILCKETHKTVLRFAPPLIIDKETIDGALDAITEVLNM